MIIAFLDDGGVVVHDDFLSVQREHEGIDVENGGVTFFDSEGWQLKAVFTRPNMHGWFSVASGEFHLERVVRADRELASALEGAGYLADGSRFVSLDDVREAVRAARECGA